MSEKDYTDEFIALADEYGIALTKEDFESAAQELSGEIWKRQQAGWLVL